MKLTEMVKKGLVVLIQAAVSTMLAVGIAVFIGELDHLIRGIR